MWVEVNEGWESMASLQINTENGLLWLLQSGMGSGVFFVIRGEAVEAAHMRLIEELMLNAKAVGSLWRVLSWGRMWSVLHFRRTPLPLWISGGEAEGRKQFLFFFWPHHGAHRILVPWPGIKPRPSAVKVQSPKHWAGKTKLESGG